MSSSDTLPGESTDEVASHLNEADDSILDATSRESAKELIPKPEYPNRFKTVKISMCKLSIDAFDKLTSNTIIAAKIEHVTIGTETLKQYRHLIASRDYTSEQRARYLTLLDDEKATALKVPTTLHQLITSRLPNLHSLTIEDRPAYSTPEGAYTTPFHSQGHDDIKHRTGIDLRWNGPYAAPGTRTTRALPAFPTKSRTYAYMAVFALLRNLRASKRHIKLDIIMRGYYGCETPGGVCEAFVAEAFDASKPLPGQVIEKELERVKVESYGARSVWFSRFEATIALLGGVVMEEEGGGSEGGV
ncbi:hypothetical protein J1614_000094 [Plenodomus biglobosus]|nr:hypothetical protein J1614_000094 [Plenodomus biglobosus]